jgi:hypothetical protein
VAQAADACSTQTEQAVDAREQTAPRMAPRAPAAAAAAPLLQRPSLALALAACAARAHSAYRNSLPNGLAPASISYGHLDGGGFSNSNQNAFGSDLNAAGVTWTRALCMCDSDKDGQTNGFELGDPCCVWAGSGAAQFTTQIGDPGHAGVRSSRNCSAVVCANGVSACTPSCSLSSGNANLRVVHGVIMSLAWIVLVPGAAALVRYGRVFGSPKGAKARATWHMQAQCLAVLLTVAGGIVGLLTVPLSSHFATKHGVVGIVVVLGALAQPFLGFCCTSLLLHRAVGYGIMALGAAALCLGLVLNDNATLLALYVAALVLGLLAVAAIELRATLAPPLQRCAGAAIAWVRGPDETPDAEVVVSKSAAVAASAAAAAAAVAEAEADCNAVEQAVTSRGVAVAVAK